MSQPVVHKVRAKTRLPRKQKKAAIVFDFTPEEIALANAIAAAAALDSAQSAK